ncbi:MAG: sensor domain-containing diguanylate cyclase [Actinomycetota bacterium]|nr:sensor domain-containing diguanylate cyclase [Actinomycetota bacterium]
MIGVVKNKQGPSAKKSMRGTKKEEIFFKSLVENAQDIIYRCKIFPEFGYEYISPSVKAKLGYNPEEYYDDSEFVYKIIHPDYINIARDINSGCYDYSKPVEICYIHRDGRILWYEDTITPFYDSFGELVAIEGILHDISERKEMEKRLSYLSFHDSLTDLYNRAYFEEELKRLDTERQIPSSIIMGDINGLKIINDAFGHKEGDEILKNCAEVLRKCCRVEDIIARWGGDEFSILLPGTNSEVALEVAKRIKENSTRTTKARIPLSISPLEYLQGRK